MSQVTNTEVMQVLIRHVWMCCLSNIMREEGVASSTHHPLHLLTNVNILGDTWLHASWGTTASPAPAHVSVPIGQQLK